MTPLTSGMIFFINSGQLLMGNMGINLSGGNISMTQKLLDGAQVGAIIQQMGGKAVPEGVGMDLMGDISLKGILSQEFPETHPGHLFSPAVEKNDVF